MAQSFNYYTAFGTQENQRFFSYFLNSDQLFYELILPKIHRFIESTELIHTLLPKICARKLELCVTKNALSYLYKLNFPQIPRITQIFVGFFLSQILQIEQIFYKNRRFLRTLK